MHLQTTTLVLKEGRDWGGTEDQHHFDITGLELYVSAQNMSFVD
jgi:hypothetical protein